MQNLLAHRVKDWHNLALLIVTQGEQQRVP